MAGWVGAGRSCPVFCKWLGRSLSAALNVAELRFYGSSSRRFRGRAGHLYISIGGLVVGDSAVERFGNLLAVGGALQIVFVGRAADEGDFGQDRGHRSAGQHYVVSFFDAAVAQAGIVGGEHGV